MSNKNINIVNRKKANINNDKMKESLISMFLLPSSILINKEEKLNKLDGNSYSFLENESNGLLYKFQTSIPYFKNLKENFIDKNFIVESDDFFEINSVDLFALQTITEFTNNNFTYKTQKNYYKSLLENTEFFELSEKIVNLNKYIISLSDLFNIIEVNLFDLASAMTSSLDEYLSRFEKDKIIISNSLFGRNIKLQDLIKKIKLCSYETDKKLIEKVKQLELEYDDDGFLYKNDFLKFLFYTMEEIKILFASIITKIIPAINVLWKRYEIKLEENKIEEGRKKEESLIKRTNEVIIPDIANDEVLKSILLPKDECKTEIVTQELKSSNSDFSSDNIVIEEYNLSSEKSNHKTIGDFEEFIIPKSEDDDSFNEEDLELWNTMVDVNDENFESKKSEDDDSFNEEDLKLWNTMVDVNDENFESKKSEVDENNFISETEDIIYESLVNEINNIESHEEENLCDDEEAITKNMDSLINEIKDSIEKEEDANNNTNEEFEY